MLREYYRLTKPGIIYGNVLTSIAGFLLAARGQVDFARLLAMAVGTSLVIASACVINNYIDRGIDRKMARTRRRALVSGAIGAVAALSYAGGLGLIGVIVLILGTNAVTVAIGVIGFIDYVVLYGLAKRHSVHSTLVGSISGAAPIAAGYTAVSGRFDTGALLLFLVMVIWQMPHFYAIGIYRLKDYRAAGLPILPVKSGVRPAKLQIVAYIAAFIIANVALRLGRYVGNVYVAVMLLAGLGWLGLALKGFRAGDDAHWARRVFFYSLLILLLMSLLLAVNRWL